MSKPEIGRLPAEEIEKEIVLDAPEKTVQALVTLVDQLIDALQASAAVGAEPAIVALKKLKFKL